MRKKLTGVMVLLLTFGGIMAQQNFHRGTLTTTDGRVFAGTAEYFNPFDNLNQIRFKADGQTEASTITAGKIKRFETESGIVLEGRLVSYDKADNRLETITYDTKVQTVTDTLLLRLLADGPLKLWIHHPPLSRDYFFIQKEGQNIEELGFRRKKDENTGNVITLYIYRNQLSFYTADNESLKNRISTLAFDEDAIKRLVNKYNDSKGHTSNKSLLKNGKGFRLAFTPRVGLMVVGIKFYDLQGLGLLTNFSSLHYIDFSPVATWQAGGVVELCLPERFGPVSVPVSVHYYTAEHTGYHQKLKEDVSFSSQTILTSIGLRYSVFLSPNWRLSPSVGITGSRIQNFETNLPEFGGAVGTSSYYLQLEVQYKRWVAAIQYQKANDFIIFSTYAGKYQRNGFTLGYRFGD